VRSSSDTTLVWILCLNPCRPQLLKPRCRPLQVALIQCAQAMGIQRYVFFSIHNCDRHPEVPLMLIKSCTEKYLETSGLNFTTFRMCGFMQVSGLTHAMHGICIFMCLC